MKILKPSLGALSAICLTAIVLIAVSYFQSRGAKAQLAEAYVATPTVQTTLAASVDRDIMFPILRDTVRQKYFLKTRLSDDQLDRIAELLMANMPKQKEITQTVMADLAPSHFSPAELEAITAFSATPEANAAAEAENTRTLTMIEMLEAGKSEEEVLEAIKFEESDALKSLNQELYAVFGGEAEYLSRSEAYKAAVKAAVTEQMVAVNASANEEIERKVKE